ncbi:MAG: hypothetical protein ACJ8GN_07230 [Longimicrobiaceae bacterium]
MSIRRSLAIVAASVAMLGSAACSGGGGGNPLASDPDGPSIPAPRDTSAMAPPRVPVG